MRVLLFNENPVVTKLVTLSAQKAGHTLQVSKDVAALEATSYDLVIVDDALYSEPNMALLDEKIEAGSKLLMANRGVQQPDDFDHLIYKPFLPTDLVELLSSIAASVVTRAPKRAPEAAVVSSSHDALEALNDLEDIEGIEGFEDTDLSLEGLELDQIEADESLTLDLDEVKSDDREFVEELLDDDVHVADGVLDREEVAELQSLLEDTDAPSEAEIEIEGLDDIEGLDEQTSGAAFEAPDELEALGAAAEDDLDLSEFEDFESTDEENKALKPEAFADAATDFDPENEIDETDLSDDEAILGSLDEALEDDGLEELDVGAFEGLDEEISKAVSELDVDEMTLELDDAMLDELGLDEVVNAADEELFGGNDLSDLDMLDERSLKRALGEAVVELEEPAQAPVAVEPVRSAINSEEPKTANVDGAEALKALLKALEQQDVAKALKGMNITVNISFGAPE